jgi:hypothetical protein
MAATEVGSVSIIDIQRGTRRFGREQPEKNAPNIWFSGTEKNEEKIRFPFLYVTMAAIEVGSVSNIDVQEQDQGKHYTPASLVVVVTYKDVLQEDFDSGIPSIENFYLQTGNNKQQTTNRKETMALEPTREWGMTEAQFQSRMQNPNPANCNNRSNCGCRISTLQS